MNIVINVKELHIHNVRLASDTATLDMITATVTVPNKKHGGRNPVWDVRVGSGGVLAKAFTVTQ